MIPGGVSLRLEKMAGATGGMVTSDEPWRGRMAVWSQSLKPSCFLDVSTSIELRGSTPGLC